MPVGVLVTMLWHPLVKVILYQVTEIESTDRKIVKDLQLVGVLAEL